jgi:bifunctional DNase/RNase
MVEFELSRIVIDEAKSEQVIVLKESGGDRIFPVIIGINEAVAIRTQIGGFVSSRPLTHDLACAIIKSLGAGLEKIVIDKLLEGTFHAKLYLKDNTGKLKIVDARPSDGVALAVRTKAPIFVDDKVLDKLAEENNPPVI